MDKKTIAIYDANPHKFCENWLTQPEPEEIHKVVRKYFKPGAPTADIGSGSGRDCAWLNENGYPCVGFDAAEGLLQEAKQNFASLDFRFATLPRLSEITDASYDNVICETVIMHLPQSEHLESLQNLLRILKPNGVLSLSWRHPVPGNRDEHGRLYEPVDDKSLIAEAEAQFAKVLYQKTFVSSSSQNTLTHLVFKKS